MDLPSQSTIVHQSKPICLSDGNLPTWNLGTDLEEYLQVMFWDRLNVRAKTI